MRNDQSTFIKELGYLIDQFDELQDLRWSDLQYLDEYRELRMKKNDGLPINQARLDELEPIYKNKIPTSARWNKFQNALTGMQIFIKEEVEDFVLDKQQEITDYTNHKKTEIETTITNGQTSINSAKDNALISIEQKKENIINYMDSTTAGAIRNDIGIMADLATEDKSSLVSAINEINSKEVDLEPIEQLLSTHTDDNVTAHKVSRGSSTFVGNSQEVTIPHGLDVTPISAYAFPTVNPEGYLGEVWIRMDETNLYIGNSGSFNGSMSWTAIG